MASFKIPAKFKKYFSTAYLYADGSLVICYTKIDKETNAPVEWATLHSPTSVGVRVVHVDMEDIKLSRIVIGNVAALSFLLKANRVDFWNDNSTNQSKLLGVKVNNVCFNFSSDYGDHIDFHSIPGLMESPVRGQLVSVTPPYVWEDLVSSPYYCGCIVNKEFSTL